MNSKKLLVLSVLLAFICVPAIFAATAKLHIDVGLNHFYKKRYLEAFNEFKSAVEIDPKNAEAHFNLGRVYKIQGFLKEAVAELQLAVTLDPSYVAAKRELDQIKSQIKSEVMTQLKIEGQEEALKQRFGEMGANVAEQRGQEFLRKNQLPQAIVAFKEALKADPNNVRLQKLLGYLSFKTDQLIDSRNFYEGALKLAPNDSEIHYAIGLIHFRTRNFDPAAASFQRAVAISPSLIKAYFALGEVYEETNRYEDAVFQFKKCLSLDPNLKAAQERLQYLSNRLSYNYFSRGSFYYQQGDYEKAEALLGLSRQYGTLTDVQKKSADDMIESARYWIGKKRAEQEISSQRKDISEQSYINKNITVEDVVTNPVTFVGQPVHWSGDVAFSDSKKGKSRFFVNSNGKVDPKSNMDFTFGVVFPKPLPNDPRVSEYSSLEIKGKIVGVEKVLNTYSSVLSSRRQPIVEATEATFSRDSYEQPLTIRYYGQEPKFNPYQHLKDGDYGGEVGGGISPGNPDQVR